MICMLSSCQQKYQPSSTTGSRYVGDYKLKVYCNRGRRTDSRTPIGRTKSKTVKRLCAYSTVHIDSEQWLAVSKSISLPWWETMVSPTQLCWRYHSLPIRQWFILLKWSQEVRVWINVSIADKSPLIRVVIPCRTGDKPLHERMLTKSSGVYIPGKVWQILCCTWFARQLR